MTFVLVCVLGMQDLDLHLERLDDDDPAVRAEASAAIRRRGSSAIPALERALGHPSVEVRGRADELLLRLPEYALRGLLRLPEYAEVRRLWTAVVEAVVWKRPIPADLGRELLRERPGHEALREVERQRDHSGLEILAGLRDAAWEILRDQLERVGMEGAQVEMSAKRACQATGVDVLPLVRRAEPDATSFEEVYGTLMLLEGEVSFHAMETWSLDDWALAVKLLVQMRRRPGAPPLGALASREEILELACRGPLVRGIADALGRAFTNQVLLKMELAWSQKQEAVGGADEIRGVYGVLFQMDRWIGRTYYQPGLLDAARPGLPRAPAAVPAPRLALFDLVNAEGEAARRVAAEVLSRPEDPPFHLRDHETAARLLRAVASFTAAAARP